MDFGGFGFEVFVWGSGQQPLTTPVKALGLCSSARMSELRALA